MGVDCGGSCRPCEMDSRLPAVKIISPFRGALYNSSRIPVRVSLNRDDIECSYSLEGRVFEPLSANTVINARRGLSNLSVYCTDSSGNNASGFVEFNVNPIQSSVCPTDSVRWRYGRFLDSIVFFRDNITQIGFYGDCRAGVFLNASSGGDDVDHAFGPYNLSGKMSDGFFGDYADGILSYSCVGGLKHEVGVLHAKSSLEGSGFSRLGVIVYFRETLLNVSDNAFWRVYAYDVNGTINPRVYLDLDYAPSNSSCGMGFQTLFQELDLTPIIEDVGVRDGVLDFRIAFYSRGKQAQLDLMEVEYSIG